MSTTLANFKQALLTGSTSGLGLILKKRLEDAGVKVFAPTRKDGYDLSKDQDQEKILTYIKNEAPDLVINCAAQFLYGPATRFSSKEHRDLIRVNIDAVSAITHQAAQTLQEKKKNGVIMNISSGTGLSPWPFFAAYAASKSFVTNFSRALDFELKGTGIRVLTSAPGMFDSSATTKSGNYTKTPKEKLLSIDGERIADEVISQIEKRAPFFIPTKRTRYLLNLSKLFPTKLKLPAMASLMKSRWK